MTVSSTGVADLTWLGISPASVSVASGTTFQVRDTLVNAGDGVSSATTVRLFWSTDPTISTGDTEFGNTASVGSLAASEQITFTYNVTFTNTGSSSVTVYVGFCVDPVEEEGNTANNCSGGSVEVTVAAAGNAESAASGSGAIEGEAEPIAPPGRDVSNRQVTGVSIRAVIENPKPEGGERLRH